MSTGEEKNTKPLPVPAGTSGRDPAPARDRPAIASEFQPDAVELEERAPPRMARFTLYGITGFITAAIVWASLSSIDEIVVAPGKLVTTEPTIVVQPLETSIIRSIDVHAGDVVRAGQTLATLDATFSQSDVEQQRAQFAALDAQVKRLEAELADVDYTAVAGNSSDEQLQVQLFKQRRAYHVAQMQNYDQQLAGQVAAISSGKDQELILATRRDGLVQIEEARETLYERETGSLLNLLGSRDARLEVETNLAQLRGNAVTAEHALAKLTADRQAFIEDFRRASVEQLVELKGQRDMAGEELKKMDLRRNMVALTAPADAVVLDLAQRSIGSVVREAEPIVTLVPLNVPLEAEVEVGSLDIGRVKAHEEVRIKLDAYPFQKFGTATGKIRIISRDAFSPDQAQSAGQAKQPYFKARILLSDTRLGGAGEPVRLLPGMTVSAEINVGRRTVLSYFLYPIIRGLDNSIREP